MSQKKKNRSTIHNPRYRNIINKLVKQRKDAGIKQEEVAKAINLTQPDISKIERFERRLDVLEFIDWFSLTGGYKDYS